MMHTIAFIEFLDLLKKAYAGECAAALAYEGHWRSLARRNPDAATMVRMIQAEEEDHKDALEFILAEFRSTPDERLNFWMRMLGRVISALCYVIPSRLANHSAKLIEVAGVVGYRDLAFRAGRLGFHELRLEFLHMAEAEKRHELFLDSL